MTCIGFAITGPDHAVAWCDSEVYGPAAAPSGHACKMAVSPFGAIVGIGTGYVAMLAEAAEVIGRALTFDEVVECLPLRLARASRTFVELHTAWSSNMWQAYAAAGFSRRFGRIVGATFDSRDDFRANVPCRSFAAPTAEIGDVDDEHEVIAAVRAQMLELQRQNPRAGAGVVIRAEITPRAVTCGPIFDLAHGTLLGRVVDPTEMSAARRSSLTRAPGPLAGVRREQRVPAGAELRHAVAGDLLEDGKPNSKRKE